MSFDYKRIEPSIVELAQLCERESSWRQENILFDCILELNSDRKKRLQEFKKDWDKRSYYIFNDPVAYQNFANISGSCSEKHLGARIEFDDLISGPGILTPRPLILTNNHLNYLLTKLTFPGLVDVRRQWAAFPWVVQDYDNHHWYQMSFLAQLLSEFYFPSHPYCGHSFNDDLQSIKNPIRIGSTQWKKKFLEDKFEEIVDAERRNEPAGRHNFYPKFTYRNRTIKTLNAYYDDVNFTDVMQFHNQDELSRLKSWMCRRLHFVVPVGGDIPIRFYDSIITGGIPLIPLAMKKSLDYYNVPREFYLCFDLEDLFNPTKLANAAIEQYYASGKEGILERVRYGLDALHVDCAIREILDVIDAEIN